MDETYEDDGWVIDDDYLSKEDRGYHLRRIDLQRVGCDGSYELLLHVLSKAWVNPLTFVPTYRKALCRFEMFDNARWETTMRFVRELAYESLCIRGAQRCTGSTDPFDKSTEKLAIELRTHGWDGRTVRD